MHSETHQYIQRQSKLNIILQSSELDAFILNPGAILFYLTGLDFHLYERPIMAIITKNSPMILVLPELEASKTSRIGFPLQIFTYPEDPTTWRGVFSQAIHSTNLKPNSQIALDANRMRFLELQYFKAALPKTILSDGRAHLSQLRISKDEKEIALLQKAVSIAQEALINTIPLIKIGMTERELAAELIIQLYRCGSDTTLPFAPIIASGQNSALPHAMPSERKLKERDMLIIDWGAKYHGYCSDLTRTFAIKEANKKFIQIADVVHQANQAGRAVAKAQMSASTVDQTTRKVIEQAGFGNFFIHRTGHGIGLEEHEEPYIRTNNEELLATGMSFTIEPGIYIEKEGGVRIEDNVVITEEGCKSLSNMTRELICVG